ncbi:hypothetical protein PanWU01x14_320130, partial [Parasponia andersonii]
MPKVAANGSDFTLSFSRLSYAMVARGGRHWFVGRQGGDWSEVAVWVDASGR